MSAKAGSHVGVPTLHVTWKDDTEPETVPQPSTGVIHAILHIPSRQHAGYVVCTPGIGPLGVQEGIDCSLSVWKGISIPLGGRRGHVPPYAQSRVPTRAVPQAVLRSSYTVPHFVMLFMLRP